LGTNKAIPYLWKEIQKGDGAKYLARDRTAIPFHGIPIKEIAFFGD
jgi:hypothetical protein